MIGVDRQKDFLQKLGLFEPTPVELVEASTGQPLVPQRWPAVTAATVSFGHGLAASPLHLASAYATIANNGRRVTPTLVHGRKRPEGQQILSPRAAAMAVDMLRQVVTRGTARQADVPGYEIAGKTGTADKPRPSGGYYKNKVMATFASTFPASDPKYVLIVSLDEPSVETAYGSESRTAGNTTVPVAAELIRRIGPLLGLSPKGDEKLPTIRARFEPRVEPREASGIKLVANQ